MPVKKQESSEGSLASRYGKLVASGRIKDDPAQRAVLARLEALQSLLGKKRPGGLFRKAPAPVAGLYIWGNVGRGKSMLMDLFFEQATVKHKRRAHFHAFMQEVHGRIHTLRQEKADDPVATLAAQIADETALLCFDELQASDPADATILYRLFSGLFEAGVTVVSTSNHPPASLYTGGHQRERFAKFIALIEQHMQVAALSSPADYRHSQIKSLRQVYFHPLGAEAEAFVDEALGQLCGDAAPQQDTLAVQGRATQFMLYDRSIGRFSFRELCSAALGPADYLALAKRLDTVILTGIPKLAPEQRNEVKRFVTLIDALYEHKVKLICTAETPPEGIYAEGDGRFEFKRTVSRLAEMQGERYLNE